MQELCGLIWAYLGPAPAPLLPRWAPLVWEDAVRDICNTELPCNWLQCQENSLDPVHAEWLHSYFGGYMNRLQAGADPERFPVMMKGHQRIGFDLFEYGIIKRRVLQGYSEEDDAWRTGHPILFPHILLVGSPYSCTMQWRVPIDDEHTYHVSMYFWRPAPGAAAPRQESIPARLVPLFDQEGRYILDAVFNQDYMAWTSQGPTPIAERNKEKLGESDKGIILFRRLLKQQIEAVQQGREPMNVFRDPAQNACIELPQERHFLRQGQPLRYIPQEYGYSADADKIDSVLETWRKAGEQIG